jgi:hypothetical protein
MTDLLKIFMVYLVGYDFSQLTGMISYQRTLRCRVIYILGDFTSKFRRS